MKRRRSSAVTMDPKTGPRTTAEVGAKARKRMGEEEKQGEAHSGRCTRSGVPVLRMHQVGECCPVQYPEAGERIGPIFQEKRRRLMVPLWHFEKPLVWPVVHTTQKTLY